jgi:hypothetical protein
VIPAFRNARRGTARRPLAGELAVDNGQLDVVAVDFAELDVDDPDLSADLAADLSEEPEVSLELDDDSVFAEIPTELNSLRNRPEHCGQVVSASSVKACTASKRSPHSVHA